MALRSLTGEVQRALPEDSVRGNLLSHEVRIVELEARLQVLVEERERQDADMEALRQEMKDLRAAKPKGRGQQPPRGQR